MSNNTTKRAQGAAEELGGKIKGAVGEVIDNEQMEVEGRATELKGQARERTNR